MDDLVHLDTSCLKNQKKILDKICLKIHFVFLFKYAEAVLLHVKLMTTTVEPLPLHVEPLALQVEPLPLQVEALVLQKNLHPSVREECKPLLLLCSMDFTLLSSSRFEHLEYGQGASHCPSLS